MKENVSTFVFMRKGRTIYSTQRIKVKDDFHNHEIRFDFYGNVACVQRD